MSKTTKTQAGERTRKVRHKPGPWFTSKPDANAVLCGDENDPEIVAMLEGDDPMFITDGEVMEANARLIAAAPALLALLKRFYAYTYGCTDDVIPDLDFEQARAAIAQAEGRAK